MKTALALLSVVSALAVTAATFPLPLPKRPTSFPLKRPTETGTVVAWGENGSGQTNRQEGLTGIVAIAAGADHTVALRNDGRVAAWGNNSSGQCTVPADLSDAVAISAGNSFTAALRATGVVVVWGADIGPIPSEATNLVAIACNYRAVLGLRMDGRVVSWGVNPEGKLTAPLNLRNVVAIGCGDYHSLAIVDDGLIAGVPFAWGDNGDGRAAVPGGLSGLVSIEGGSNSSIGLRRDGTLVEWGFPRTSPTYATNLVAIALGDHHRLALTSEGRVISWPTDWSGAKVPNDLPRAIAVAAGGNHSVALVSDGVTNPNWATAQAQVVNGFVVGVTVINPGRGYTEPPLVLIRGGNGTGATAVATIADGAVTGIAITNPGSGYTEQPSVLVASPQFAPEASIEVSRVKVTMRVVLGRKYQIQSSRNLENWAVAEPEFTADSENIVREFSVEEAGRHFRVVELP